MNEKREAIKAHLTCLQKQLQSVQGQIDANQKLLDEIDDPQRTLVLELHDALNGYPGCSDWALSPAHIWTIHIKNQQVWHFSCVVEQDKSGKYKFWLEYRNEDMDVNDKLEFSTVKEVVEFYQKGAFAIDIQAAVSPTVKLSAADALKIKEDPCVECHIYPESDRDSYYEVETHIQKMDITTLNIHTGERSVEKWVNDQDESEADEDDD